MIKVKGCLCGAVDVEKCDCKNPDGGSVSVYKCMCIYSMFYMFEQSYISRIIDDVLYGTCCRLNKTGGHNIGMSFI